MPVLSSKVRCVCKRSERKPLCASLKLQSVREADTATFHFSLFIFSHLHIILHAQAAERKQARSAQRAAGTAQRLFFTPAAEKYTATT